MKTKKNKYLLYTSKNAIKKHLDLLLLEEKDKNYLLLSKILIHLYIIIYYIVEENIFVVTGIIFGIN